MNKTAFNWILLITCIVLLATCANYRLYPGNYAANHSFHNKASLKRVADSLYAADTTNKCLVVYVKGKWMLSCEKPIAQKK